MSRPSLLDPPPGCWFAVRCPFTDARCHAEPPPSRAIGRDHRVACWHAEDADALRGRAADPATWAALGVLA